MSDEIYEIQEKILLFLYWEGTIDPTYLSVNKIEDETELSSLFVENGMKTLRENGWVECIIREKDVGVEGVRITGKGIDKVQSLISLRGARKSR